MEVKSIMTKTVKAVNPADSIKDVAVMICTGNFSGTPVIDENNQVVGMISEKDILKAMYPSQQDFHEDPNSAKNFDETKDRYTEVMQKSVNDCMCRNVTAVNTETHILEAASIMLRRIIRRIPVIDRENRLVGIVSQGDIHQAIFKNKLIDQ